MNKDEKIEHRMCIIAHMGKLMEDARSREDANDNMNCAADVYAMTLVALAAGMRTSEDSSDEAIRDFLEHSQEILDNKINKLVTAAWELMKCEPLYPESEVNTKTREEILKSI